ncbi:hypothetical protein GCM10009525_61670 [Streptosporangium amethystogenes subsp. fukuiense]
MEALEDEAHRAPVPVETPAPEIVDAPPSDVDLTPVGEIHRTDEMEERGLARSRGPGERDRLTGLDLQADLVECPGGAVYPADASQADFNAHGRYIVTMQGGP